MAKTTTRISRLRGLMAKAELTRAKVAEALAVPEATVESWERSIADASGVQIKDLAVLLEVPVGVLLGLEVQKPQEKDELYGSLKIRVPRHKLDYPVNVANRDDILDQLETFDIQSDAVEPRWFSFETLNNKLVFANPSFVQQIELASDDEEATMPYDHPLVYEAFSDWNLDNPVGPVVQSRCDALLEVYGAKIIKESQYARVLTSKGSVRWHFMLELEDTIGFWTFGLTSGEKLLPNRFIRVKSEGYHVARYINLSTVAVMEIPLGRFIRIENEAAEVDDDVDALVKKVLEGSDLKS